MLATPTTETVFVVEGEKDVDRLRGDGVVATCNPMGAGNWRREYSEFLRGRNVVLIPDNDEAGRQHAGKVAHALDAVAASVGIVELPGVPERGDVTAWLDAGHTVEELNQLSTESEATEAALSGSTPGTSCPVPPRFARTDAGNGEAFGHLFAADVRFDHKRRRWIAWRGQRWQEDDNESVYQLAKQAARWRYGQAESIVDLMERRAEASWAISSENRTRIEAGLTLARSESAIADDGEQWDTQPDLLGVLNGVVDLKTGELIPATREQRITRQAPVAFDRQATCPVFDAFLERVQPDPTIRAYLQRRAGYALTDDTSEQDLLFLHGGGSNGKTTWINCLMDVLGRDYALQAAPGLLLRKRNESHPTEVADLDGARLVVSSEVDDGRALAEGLLKQLTGGDRLKARRMRQDFYEFESKFKLVLLANHKPTVRGTDWAIWRRIKLIPFDETISPSEKDPHLRKKLQAERAGILNWMIAGCLGWRRNGMSEPESVSSATADYRTESNPLSGFLTDTCVLGQQFSVAANAAYIAYKSWAASQGMGIDETISSTAFGKLIGQRFVRQKRNTANFYLGFGLLSEHQQVMPMEGLEPTPESEVEGFQKVLVETQPPSDRKVFSQNDPQPSTPSMQTDDGPPLDLDE